MQCNSMKESTKNTQNVSVIFGWVEQVWGPLDPAGEQVNGVQGLMLYSEKPALHSLMTVLSQDMDQLSQQEGSVFEVVLWNLFGHFSDHFQHSGIDDDDFV